MNIWILSVIGLFFIAVAAFFFIKRKKGGSGFVDVADFGVTHSFAGKAAPTRNPERERNTREFLIKERAWINSRAAVEAQKMAQKAIEAEQKALEAGLITRSGPAKAA